MKTIFLPTGADWPNRSSSTSRQSDGEFVDSVKQKILNGFRAALPRTKLQSLSRPVVAVTSDAVAVPAPEPVPVIPSPRCRHCRHWSSHVACCLSQTLLRQFAVFLTAIQSGHCGTCGFSLLLEGRWGCPAHASLESRLKVAELCKADWLLSVHSVTCFHCDSSMKTSYPHSFKERHTCTD